MAKRKYTGGAHRASDRGTIKEVRLDKMHIQSRHAQREKINEARVDYLVSRFDFEKFGTPTLSARGDGEYYIIDGQHRIEALKRWLGTGWESSTIPCRVYDGLSEEEEAEAFLSMNDVLAVNVFDKFRVSVAAGRKDETHIQAIVTGAGLNISRNKTAGSISCVGTLKRVYQRSDGETLARALRIARDAFGDSGLDSLVVDGIGHLAQRYNGVLVEDVAIQRLGKTFGGVQGLVNKAAVLHKQTGNPKAQCVAAAAVEIINGVRGGNKLPSWWKAE